MRMINTKTRWVPKMIVFDKDGKLMCTESSRFLAKESSYLDILFIGTLGDCTESLHTWAKRMTESILLECQNMNLSNGNIEKIVSQFHHDIGWNPINESLSPSSLLSSGTWGQILDATALAIEKHTNGDLRNIREKVELFNANMGDTHANDKPLVDDIQGLLTLLKHQNRGLLIAICTSDDRRSTNSCIKNWQIEKHIDVSSKAFEGIFISIVTLYHSKQVLFHSFRFVEMKFQRESLQLNLSLSYVNRLK